LRVSRVGLRFSASAITNAASGPIRLELKSSVVRPRLVCSIMPNITPPSLLRPFQLMLRVCRWVLSLRPAPSACPPTGLMTFHDKSRCCKCSFTTSMSPMATAPASPILLCCNDMDLRNTLPSRDLAILTALSFPRPQ